MDLKDFVEEASKSQSDGEVPWHLKSLCEHIEIVKNGGKVVIDPWLMRRCYMRRLRSEIMDRG